MRARISLNLFTLLALLGAPLAAIAADPAPADAAWPDHSFRQLSGGAVACKLPSPDVEFGCLRIGELQIGMPWERVKAQLGAPWKHEDLPDGGVREVFLVDRDNERRTFSYWVLDSRDGKLVAAQLTGNHAPADATNAPGFSGLHLGDPQGRVRELLGPRFQAKAVPDVGAVLWDYTPHRFSIEFVDGRIYSLRVSASNG